MSADRRGEGEAEEEEGEPPPAPPLLAFFFCFVAPPEEAPVVADAKNFMSAVVEEALPLLDAEAAETEREAKARGDVFLEAGHGDGRRGRVPAVGAAACGDENDESQSSIDGCGLGCRSSLKPLRTEKDETELTSTLQRPLQLGRSSAAAATAADGRRPIFDFCFFALVFFLFFFRRK